MQKKSLYVIAAMLLCLLVCFAGRTFLHKKGVIDQTGKNGNGIQTEVMGRLEHGLSSFSVDKNTGNAFITYEGGELQIEYKAKAVGMSECGIGFMIFIDGIPQPYRTSEETESKHMHTFYFLDEVNYTFSFYLIPNTGRKGDVLELCIASVYYPDYTPDMRESEGYGIFHDMLENSYLIQYNASPSWVSDSVAQNLICEVKTEERLAQDKNTTSNLSNDLNAALYINDQDFTNGNYYIANKKKNNVKLEICGTKSANYRISFFINHCLVSKGWETELLVQVQPDKITVIDAEIDISPLMGYDTFYVLMVPCDVSQIATRSSGLVKTNSVLLVPPFNQQNEAKQLNVTLDDVSGTMNCVGDGRLMLVGTKITLLDARTLEIQKDAENTAPLLHDPQAGLREDAFVFLGAVPAKGHYMVEYDPELHVDQITDIEETVASKREIMTCKLIAGGTKLLYNDVNGLYVFNFATGETTDLSQDEFFVYDFAYLEQSEDVLFIGTDFTSERVLGIMHADGKRQQKVSGEHLWGKVWAFGDFALIEEAELVGKEKEGMVFRYVLKDGILSFPLASNTENGNITVSCHGSYYSTCTKMQDEETQYVIRVYSSEDGSMVKELPLTNKEYGADFRLRGHLMCEDVDAIIIYGTWKGRENNTWIASKSLSF